MMGGHDSIGWGAGLQRHPRYDDQTEQGEQAGPGPRNAASARTIVLVGMMGAGKNYVGRRLATRMGRPFLDADAEIETAAGCTIAEIFARFGEPYFRDGERRVIARLLDGPAAVLASGGGAFIDAETRAAIAARGISVWLRAELDVLVKRTAGRNHRPILQAGEPRQILARLMEQRYPIYAEADIVVDANERPADDTVEAIIAALGAGAQATVKQAGVKHANTKQD